MRFRGRFLWKRFLVSYGEIYGKRAFVFRKVDGEIGDSEFLEVGFDGVDEPGTDDVLAIYALS